MLFAYELKKIFKRMTPLVCLIFLVSVTIVTTIITATAFNTSPNEVDNSTEYVALKTKINSWQNDDQENTATAFNTFYQDYCALNATTEKSEAELKSAYETAYASFQTFYNWHYKTTFVDTDKKIADFWLVKNNYLKDLNNIMDTLSADLFKQAHYDTGTEIISALSVNTRWKYATLQEILSSLRIQKISNNDLSALKLFFAQNPNYSEPAYSYAWNKYCHAVNAGTKFNGKLNEYEGFENYISDHQCQSEISLASARLKKPNYHYSNAFAFGEIFNNTNQVSIFDFIFTNMEMAWIPLLILIIIFTACAFFTDTYQRTIITSLSVTRNRYRVIIAKTLAVIALATLYLFSFTALYLAFGILFFKAQLAPDILCLFNGTDITIIPQFSYFILYLLGMLFKFLPFIAICGIFSLLKTDPRIIVALTATVAGAILLLNWLLGGLAFYQIIPLLALNPLSYFGANHLASPMPSRYNLWFTFPVLLIIDIVLYVLLFRSFKKRDF